MSKQKTINKSPKLNFWNSPEIRNKLEADKLVKPKPPTKLETVRWLASDSVFAWIKEQQKSVGNDLEKDCIARFYLHTLVHFSKNDVNENYRLEEDFIGSVLMGVDVDSWTLWITIYITEEETITHRCPFTLHNYKQ
jgi:hypothetical protein